MPRRRKGVAKGMCFSDTLFQDPVIYEVRELLEDTFEFNAVQVNRYDPIRWAKSEIHTDGGNYADSRMMVLGDFQGGSFLLFPDGRHRPPSKIDVRHQWIAFDGHLFHGSEAITQGSRYSVIAFTFGDRG